MFDIEKAKNNYKKSCIDYCIDDIANKIEENIDKVIEDTSNRGQNAIALDKHFYCQIILDTFHNITSDSKLEESTRNLMKLMKSKYTKSGYVVETFELPDVKDYGIRISWE